jgi:chromate transport protein ChrA
MSSATERSSRLSRSRICWLLFALPVVPAAAALSSALSHFGAGALPQLLLLVGVLVAPLASWTLYRRNPSSRRLCLVAVVTTAALATPVGGIFVPAALVVALEVIGLIARRVSARLWLRRPAAGVND